MILVWKLKKYNKRISGGKKQRRQNQIYNVLKSS
jgi:hypothetical protein